MLPISNAQSQDSNSGKVKRIAVIGAGMAGLAAANHLQKLGHNVTVIEGRERIGGRIWTSTQWSNMPLDLGATWIHGTQGNPLTALADGINAKRFATNSESAITYGVQGQELTKAQTKEAVMNALLKVTEFDVPKALIQSETTELASRARQDLKARGMQNVEEIQLPEDIFAAQAERRVRLGLIVSDLVKENSLQAKPEQVRAFIEEQAQSYENPAEVMQWYFQDRARLADVEAVILEDNVVEFALGKSKVVEKKLSFDELMGNK